MLTNKTAVIYGGGRAIGGTVARTFARDGARVFLTGRTLAKVQAVANDSSATGTSVDAGQFDALNEEAIENHLDAVVKMTGQIDISFNAVGFEETRCAGCRSWKMLPRSPRSWLRIRPA